MGFAPPLPKFKKREREIITEDLRGTRVKSLSTVILLLFLLVIPKGMAVSTLDHIHNELLSPNIQCNAMVRF